MFTHTVADCTLNGKRIQLERWSHLSSAELAAIVGQQPDGESGEDYTWHFAFVPLNELRECDYDGEPDGGWVAAYRRNVAADQEAVRNGEPAYAGRDVWLHKHWTKNTAIFPIYLVKDEDGLRIIDGRRRLAGAFFHQVPRVAALIGMSH